MTSRLVALSILVCVSALSKQAFPCSPVSPLAERTVWPSAGATGVPTNTRVTLRYGLTTGEYNPEIAHRVLTDILLRPATGDRQPVAAEVALHPMFVRYGDRRTVVILRPAGQLQPNTSYEVLDRLVVPCRVQVCTLAEHQVISSFTTGAEADRSHPTFAGPIVVTLGDVETTMSTCGAGSFGRVRIEWSPATDEGPVRYSLLNRGAAQYMIRDWPATVINGGYVCKGDPSVGDVEIVPGSYAVAAEDLAGNRFEQRFEILPPYEKCHPAAGADGGQALADAALATDTAAPADGPAPSTDSAACATSGAARPGARGPGWGLLAACFPLLALLARRRRP